MKKKNIMMITMVIVSTLVLLLTVACISRPETDDVVQDSTPSENIVTTEPQPEQDTEDTTAPTENSTDEPTQPEAPDTEPVDNKNQIIGKYTCVSDYCNENLKDRPDYLPAITFNNNDTCEMLVNYIGGSTLLPGVYTIEDNKIFVEVDPSGTPVGGIDKATDQPYMDDKYVFEIIDYDHLTFYPAEGSYYNDCYVVRSGDPFERQ